MSHQPIEALLQAVSVKVPGIATPMTWVNQPARFKVTETGIDISAGARTDRYIAPDGGYVIDKAPRLLIDADRDFTLTAKISHAFAEKWDAGVLVLEADAQNWIKFCFEKDYLGKHRVVTVVTRGVSDDANSIAIDGDSVYYRLAKVGDAVYMYASTDPKSWLLIRALNFKTSLPLKTGFMAQAPNSDGADVRFRDVTYQTAAMKDFWKGE